jgi:hypothetical protein
MPVRGGLARATRDYTNIIGGFVWHLLWFGADRWWYALRRYLHFPLKPQNHITITKIANRSSTVPHQTLQNLSELSGSVVN